MSGHDSNDSLPESAMGGASDAGAHGKHPASAAKLENRSPLPEDVPGDAAIERRHGPNPNYTGPERRLGRTEGARASD
jgi:hypothetical protein